MTAYRRKDRDNHWYYRRWVTLPNGTRVKIGGKAPLNTKASALAAEHAHVERTLHPPVIEAPEVLVPRVDEYVTGWIERRKARGIASVAMDESRLRLHVVPRLGAMRLNEVRPSHARDLVESMRAEGKLAPRSILKVTATLHALFKSALVEELIVSNPVVFEAGVLPKKADKEADWRVHAIYTREEITALISDDRIPPDRRVVYALKALAALRHGEVNELRWEQVDTSTEPLGRILLAETKSGVPRAVPIHPALAAMLTVWRSTGWENTFGRKPTATDLVVPTLTFRPRVSQDAQDALVADLTTLDLSTRASTRMNRRGHDLRRTFVSLAQADGARRDVIEWGTHGPRGDIMSMYTSLPWPTLCEEWSKLRVELPAGGLLTLRHDNPSALTIRGAKRWSRTPGGPRRTVAKKAEPQPFVIPPESVVTPLGLEGGNADEAEARESPGDCESDPARSRDDTDED